MDMMALMYVAVGGAIGSMARYGMKLLVDHYTPGPFPYGTLLVNIIGGFLMGCLMAAIANILPARAKDLHLLLAVGVLGGFTTFSSFSLDLFTLYVDRLWLEAIVYAVGSVIFSLVALMVGMWLTQKLMSA